MDGGQKAGFYTTRLVVRRTDPRHVLSLTEVHCSGIVRRIRHSWERGHAMKATAWIGAILIALGAVALVYKGFNYKTEDTVLQIGNVKATAEKDNRVPIPAWAGVAAIVVGVLVLVAGRKR
jgi:hypothetical protein